MLFRHIQLCAIICTLLSFLEVVELSSSFVTKVLVTVQEEA